MPDTFGDFADVLERIIEEQEARQVNETDGDRAAGLPERPRKSPLHGNLPPPTPTLRLVHPRSDGAPRTADREGGGSWTAATSDRSPTARTAPPVPPPPSPVTCFCDSP